MSIHESHPSSTAKEVKLNPQISGTPDTLPETPQDDTTSYLSSSPSRTLSNNDDNHNNHISVTTTTVDDDHTLKHFTFINNKENIFSPLFVATNTNTNTSANISITEKGHNNSNQSKKKNNNSKRKLLEAMRSTLAKSPTPSKVTKNDVSFDDTRSEFMKSFRSFVDETTCDEGEGEGGDDSILGDSILSYESSKRDFFMNLRSFADSPDSKDQRMGNNDASFERKKNIFMSLRNLATGNNDMDTTAKDTSFNSRAGILSSLRVIARVPNEGKSFSNGNDTSFDSKAGMLSSLRGIANPSTEEEGRSRNDTEADCESKANIFASLKDIASPSNDEGRKSENNTDTDSQPTSEKEEGKSKNDTTETNINSKSNIVTLLRDIPITSTEEEKKLHSSDRSSNIELSTGDIVNPSTEVKSKATFESKESTLSSLKSITNTPEEEQGKSTYDIDSKDESTGTVSQSRSFITTLTAVEEMEKSGIDTPAKSNQDISPSFSDITHDARNKIEREKSMFSLHDKLESCKLPLRSTTPSLRKEAECRNMAQNIRQPVLSEITNQIAPPTQHKHITPQKESSTSDDYTPESQKSNVATTSSWKDDLNVVASLSQIDFLKLGMSQIGLSHIGLIEKENQAIETPRTKNSSDICRTLLSPATLSDEILDQGSEIDDVCIMSGNAYENILSPKQDQIESMQGCEMMSKTNNIEPDVGDCDETGLKKDILDNVRKEKVSPNDPDGNHHSTFYPKQDKKILSPEVRHSENLFSDSFKQDHNIQDIIADDLSEVSSLGNTSITSISSHSKHMMPSQYVRLQRSRMSLKSCSRSQSTLEQIQRDLKKIALLAKSDINQDEDSVEKAQLEILEKDISNLSICSTQENESYSKIDSKDVISFRIAPSKNDVKIRRRNTTTKTRRTGDLSIYDGVMRGFQSLQNEIDLKEREKFMVEHKHDLTENERLYNEFKSIEERESRRKMDVIWSNMSSSVVLQKDLSDQRVFAFPSLQNTQEDDEVFQSLLNDCNSSVKECLVERKKKTYAETIDGRNESNKKKKIRKKLLKKLKSMLTRKKKSKSNRSMADDQSILGISAIDSYAEDIEPKKERKMRFPSLRRKLRRRSSVQKSKDGDANDESDDESNISERLEQLMVNLDIDPLNCSDFSCSDSDTSEINVSFNYGYASLA